MVCGGLWWFVVDCGGLPFSHTAQSCRVLGGIFTDRRSVLLVSIIMLCVRGNNDTDDAEYYVNHLMFAAFR